MSWSRSVLVAFTICSLLRTASSGDSAAVHGAAMLQQVRTMIETALDQPLKQSGLITVHIGPKPLDGQYTYASSGSLWRDEIVVAGY